MKMKVTGYVFSLALAGSVCLGAECSGTKEVGEPPVKVQVEEVKGTTGGESFAYSGTIEAEETMPLGFSVTGTVARVLVAEGDFVRKGQVLVELNDATLRNTFEMAQAALQRADDAYRRLKPMYDKKSLAEIKFVEAETNLQQAKAAAANAAKDLDECKLRAPVGGFVGLRSVDPGMNVAPGAKALEILRIDSVFARVPVSERDIARISKGQAAIVTVGAIGIQAVQGTIHEIGVQADRDARTYKIKIILPNGDHAMKPGMVCDVRIPIEDRTTGIVLPIQAVRVDEHGRTFVYALDDAGRRALRHYVESGRLLNDGIEIESGLRQGQRVVVAGQQKLVDNCNVEIVN
jgi:membrane fusion protein (multidrug efflux system)